MNPSALRRQQRKDGELGKYERICMEEKGLKISRRITLLAE